MTGTDFGSYGVLDGQLSIAATAVRALGYDTTRTRHRSNLKGSFDGPDCNFGTQVHQRGQH